MDLGLIDRYIDLEFSIRKKIVAEKHGIVPNIMQLISPVVDRFIELYKTKQQKSYTITQKVYRKDKKPLFFNRMKIIIRFIQPTDGGYGNYAFNNKKLNVNDELRQMIIEVNLPLKDLKSMSETLTVLLSHEITHAWEDYSRKKKGNPSLYQHVLDVDYKKSEKNGNDDNITKIVKDLSYYLFDFERNAYIGSIYSDLVKYKSELLKIHKSKKVEKPYSTVVGKTSVYQTISYVENIVDILTNVSTVLGQQKIVLIWNNISKIKFKNYEEFCNKINYLFNKFLSKFYSVVSKTIYDILNENKDIIRIEGNRNTLINLNEIRF